MQGQFTDVMEQRKQFLDVEEAASNLPVSAGEPHLRVHHRQGLVCTVTVLLFMSAALVGLGDVGWARVSDGKPTATALTKAFHGSVLSRLRLTTGHSHKFAQQPNTGHPGHPSANRARHVLCSVDPSWRQFLLSPAGSRDVAAEAVAEAARARVVDPVKDKPAPLELRPLMTIVADGGAFRQLVAEEIQGFKQGPHAGETWLKPLALRSSKNATLARAAKKFDPSIGWLDGAIDSELHLFSPLAPSFFLPTAKLSNATPLEATAVRLLQDTHIFEYGVEESELASDMQAIRDFCSPVSLDAGAEP